MRASILAMGPLLMKSKQQVPLHIGTRPVDLHIRAMQQLGAQVELADGYVKARAPKGLKGCEITFPFVSVGATENAMMAACLAELFNTSCQMPQKSQIVEDEASSGGRRRCDYNGGRGIWSR